MKKLVSILCITILLVTSVFPVSAANDGNERTLTGMELSINRISADLAGKSKEEVAKGSLIELGMSERLVEGVNKEYLDMIYNAKSISAYDQYGKVNSEGEIILLTDEEFVEENSSRLQINSGISTLSLVGETSEERTDALFNKSLYVIETKNAPVGTMGIITTFEWIDEPFYRCLDVIAISSPQITFHEEETFLVVAYNETVVKQKTLEIISSESFLEEYDYSALDYDKKLLYGSNFVAAKYNLPNDLNVGWKKHWRHDIGFILMGSGKVTYVQEGLEVELGITGSYFHQKILFEGDISLSMNDLSLSISPAYKYDDPNLIQLTPTFTS